MSSSQSNQSPSPLVYVGSYGDAHSSGAISIYRLDTATGHMTPTGPVISAANPSYMALTPSLSHLYAVNELTEHDGRPGGMLSAYTIDRSTGNLTLINRQPTHGGLPCYVTLDPSGRWALVTNYLSGSVTVLPITAGGALGAPTAVIEHKGNGPHPQRQDKAYAHSVTFDPSQRVILVADLGIDKIMLYRLDDDSGRLTPHTPPWCPSHPGAGPRHLVFHPNGLYLYASNELDSTVSVLSYNTTQGSLEEIQAASTLPAGFTGDNTCADIHILPAGRFVYVSNRGHDSIAIFAVGSDGRLSPAGHVKTHGRIPRNFGLTPSGDLMLVANQESNTIVAFRVNQEDGQLSSTGAVTTVARPVFVGIVNM